jgi:hypothetical protein
MLLRTKYAILIMWFSGPFWHQVFFKSLSKKKFCRHGQNNKNRKKRSTNMLCGLLKEFHALIPFACYDLPSLMKRGASLLEGTIKNVMTSIFYGNDKNDADSHLITYVNQFMLGLNKFKGL